MSRLNDKQTLLATIAVPVLLIGGVGYLAWSDYQKIHAAELSDEHPEAAEITDPEQFGELRKIQEIEKEMARLQGEADLIAKREQDVIVYREITKRDAAVLPDDDFVNQLATTINDFGQQTGVEVTSVGELNTVGAAGQAIARVPIRLSLRGSFDQFLRFLNLFESLNRIVNTRGFSINAGQRISDDPSEPVVHGIQLELETYKYTPGVNLAKPVVIANYERRRDDPVIQKLVKQQKAARVETYQLKPRINRRDPLVDPRRSQAGPEDGGVSQKDYEEQRRLLEKLKHEIDTLREDIRLEKQYLEEHKYLQYVQIKSLNDEKIQALEPQVREAGQKISVSELRDQFTDDVAVPFDKMAADRGQKGQAEILVVEKKHVAPFVEEARNGFDAQKYEECVQTARRLDDFLVQKNRKVAEDAVPLVAQVREFGRQAGVMVEFLAMKLEVNGLIRRPSASIVILNGRSRKPGDFVDKAGRCRLVAIREDALVFEIEDCEITHELTKK